MTTPSERIEILGHQFDSLVQRLNSSPTLSLEERTQLLRRMKILIVEIDRLILSDLKRDKQDITSSPLRGQSITDA
jgi:hypothetical protein